MSKGERCVNRPDEIESYISDYRREHGFSPTVQEMVSISHTYYVTYRAMNGQTVEAQLGSGKSVDFRIGKKTWDHDLQEGTPVRIKYLPEKTNYAIRVG